MPNWCLNNMVITGDQKEIASVKAFWAPQLQVPVIALNGDCYAREAELRYALVRVNEQIDATVKDAVERARRQLPQGPGLERCEECDAPIPPARRRAMPGVRLCVSCQEVQDRQSGFSGYNRRGSKDSQLR